MSTFTPKRYRCLLCNELGHWRHYALLSWETPHNTKVVSTDWRQRALCDQCWTTAAGRTFTLTVTKVSELTKDYDPGAPRQRYDDNYPELGYE